MSLKPLIELMEELHSAPPDKRDGGWAYDLNRVRLEMRQRIFEVFPSSEEVRKEILPLYYRSIGALESLLPNPDDSLGGHIPGFIENFQISAQESEVYARDMQEDKTVQESEEHTGGFQKRDKGHYLGRLAGFLTFWKSRSPA